MENLIYSIKLFAKILAIAFASTSATDESPEQKSETPTQIIIETSETELQSSNIQDKTLVLDSLNLTKDEKVFDVEIASN